MALRVLKLGTALLACVALVACETINEKRTIDYKSASRSLPPLEVPPDLMSLPEVAAPAGAPARTTFSEFSSEKKTQAPVVNAGAPAVLPPVREARIERDGQVRWLVVQGNAESVWPRVREFVSSAGLIVERENPVTGVIETDWAESRPKVGSAGQTLLSKWLGMIYSNATRDKFRFRLERGAQPGTTEIYLTHRGMEEDVVSKGGGPDDQGLRWKSRSPEPETEAEMMRLLLVHLGKTEEQAKAIVAQTPPAAAPRAQLARRDDTYKLSLEDSLDRAWRRVGLSLDRGGFTVEDRDRSKGIYFVRYIDPDKQDSKPGFFGRLFGATETKKDEERYQIHVQSADRGATVVVKTADGAPETGKTGERILNVLYEQLK